MAKPVTPAQASVLEFFGRSLPATAAQAHALITELLAIPGNQQRWILERARRLLARAPNLYRSPEHPQNSHDELFKAACALVHGFELDQGSAFTLLREYANRSDMPWTDQELQYKLRSAAHSAHELPRGHLLSAAPISRPADAQAPAASEPMQAPRPASSPRKLVEFSPEKLRGLAAKWRRSDGKSQVTVEWLANRSAADPFTIGPATYLAAMYRPGEKVLVFTVYRSQGQALWPSDEVPTVGEDGVWYLAQPVTGETLPNPRTGKMSRRSMESVTAFRYLVLESDQADSSDWLGFIVQLPLRIEALYTSGGRSVHALVRVDCTSHSQWEEYVRGLMPTLNLLGMAGVDPAALTSVRLTRLPGCLRAGRLQKLLFFMPNRPADDVRPIDELPVMRAVVDGWLGQYRQVIDGHAEPSRELARALSFYAPCNASCRRALADIEALPATGVS